MLNKEQLKHIGLYALGCSILNLVFAFAGHLLFSQINPIQFMNMLDFSVQYFLNVGFAQWIIEYAWFGWLLDFLFYGSIIALSLAVAYNHSSRKWLGWLVAITALLYGLGAGVFMIVKNDSFLAWIFFGLFAAYANEKDAYWRLGIFRYIFIIAFFTAGVFKIYGGAYFDLNTMSAIFVEQHSGLLYREQSMWADMYKWLITHPHISRILYWLGTLAELSFVIGFFTRRYDKLLFVVFVLFLISDILLMNIINFHFWLIFGAGMLFNQKRVVA